MREAQSTTQSRSEACPPVRHRCSTLFDPALRTCSHTVPQPSVGSTSPTAIGTHQVPSGVHSIDPMDARRPRRRLAKLWDMILCSTPISIVLSCRDLVVYQPEPLPSFQEKSPDSPQEIPMPDLDEGDFSFGEPAQTSAQEPL